ncbi:MAG: [FeFe] hydrogenase H-cluster radical SAM maturase HydE [Prevotellaceae bacterium]|jgi:biotin synthase|nr:[FeFe] hydrogenase H-cluster radical SAM maturase HydE [Prevotellaceae bacterium]
MEDIPSIDNHQNTSGRRKIFLRGLIEFSNRCRKNCYYCGIRAGNRRVERYDMPDDEILQAVDTAWRNRYGSIVLQSGERNSAQFTARVTRLLKKIKTYTNGETGITLACGEQSVDVYRRWFEAGAHRYLLRIETASRSLYARLHPDNATHRFDARLTALRNLKDIGYLTGTGVMIGLPFQTADDLAADLLFFQKMDVDMVGMGPYIEHSDTPLYRYRHMLLPPARRLELSLQMIADLRRLMPHINIAAATALQALHPTGREQAIRAGANVFMPNLTPAKYRAQYRLYDNKPCLDEAPLRCHHCVASRIGMTGCEIGYGEWGDRR